MKRMYAKKLKSWLVILLSASLTCGCVIKKPAPPDVSQDYETYSGETVAEQKKFDQFTEDLFKEEVAQSGIDLHYSLADPAAYGITEFPVTFGDFTLEQMKKDTESLKELKTQLANFSAEHLREDQQLTHEILSTYIDTELSAEGMELYAQPLTPTIGIQAQLPILLAEYSFYTRSDVDNYLNLLAEIDNFYNQIMSFEKLKSEAGLFMSDIAVDHVIESCRGYMLAPDKSFLTETFETRLNGLTELTEEEKKHYLTENTRILNEHFIPAYQLLIDGLTELKGTGKNNQGICYYPEGKQYYEYLVKSNTGTSYASVEKLKEAIEKQMNDDLISTSKIIQEHPDIYEMLDDYSFHLTDPNEILNDLQQQIKNDFPELPECNYTVKYVPKALESTLSPAFYLTPPIDRYYDNVIYINGNEAYKNSDIYTTLAHEGYPGHLYQTVYFSQKNTCNLRKLLSFSSYSEGWATYVEYYAYTLDNGLKRELGEILAHSSSATLALHALLDININYYGWDKDKTREYLQQYYDIDGSDIVDDMYYALVENPTNYLEYYTGYLEINNMKQLAMKKQKNDFNLKEFNSFILDIGPAPLSVIQNHFQIWLINHTKLTHQEKNPDYGILRLRQYGNATV